MKFTLYIDESGDFESSRGQWVLAGVIFADGYDNCENFLKKKMDRFPKKVGLKSIDNFHLTELRSNFGHARALEIAGNLYSQLMTLDLQLYTIATINRTKSKLSEREKTYRLMLADLLAICETALLDDEVISKLDIVVASRTINGVRQTTVSDINKDIVATLPSTIEMGLATKGLIKLLGKNIKIHMDYASNSWGLVAADFLANINYHSGRKNEKEFLSSLSAQGKFQLFESLGSLDVRRARVAERDKYYASAINRWLDIACRHQNSGKFDREIIRIMGKLFNSMGTTGYKVEFENLLELLWRSNNRAANYTILLKKLSHLERIFIVFSADISPSLATGLLFRLRNMMLLAMNHIGSTKGSAEIIQKQVSEMAGLATNPEYFHIVLDFKILQIEYHVNSMEISKALQLAKDYVELVESYRSLWQLLLSDDDVKGFEESRLRMKSEMSLFRVCILATGVIDSLPTSRCVTSLLELEQFVDNPLDKSRLSNYRAMHLLRQGKPERAISQLLSDFESVERWGLYDIHGLLRAINDALLKCVTIDIDKISPIVDAQVEGVDLSASGHPVDIILRELSLFEFLRGNRSKAKKLIARSRAALAEGDSAIFDYLQVLTDIHEDYFYSRLASENTYLSRLHGEISSAMAQDDKPLLEKFRYFSFY